MKHTMSVFVVLLLELLIAIATNNISFCKGSSNVGCIVSEREALLRFKKDLNDPSNRLASWNLDGDCCKWAGVVCNNATGHVLQLHLRSPLDQIDYASASAAEIKAYKSSKLGGKINPSLLNLMQLTYFDLSLNNFGGIEVPKFLGYMRNLRYLNLSNAGFVGLIPPQIGNLSNLQHLDLSNNTLQAGSLHWLSGLSLLKHLDLSQVDLSTASDWLSMINPLPSLAVLELSICYITHIPTLPVTNFSSLTTLDLSYNSFNNSLIPDWVFSLSHLVHLDLSYNPFEGSIPDGLQNLTSLRHLDLSFNSFNHSIPSWLDKFSHLEFLSLQFNNFLGSIPPFLGNLTSIKMIFLSYNYRLQGRIPRSFGSLCNLRSISLIDVNMSQDISEILDLFSGCVSNKIEVLDFESSQLYGSLTNQLGNFRSLKTLNLFNNSVSGSIPSSIGELSSLVFLQLSSNKLNGSIPFSLGNMSSLESLDFSYNKLNGTLLPDHFVNLTRLSSFYVSGNSLMMKVYPNWVPPFQLRKIGLRSCQVVGHQFPSWLLSQKFLSHLDISKAGISDAIPNKFWKSISGFNYLNLSNNKIYGELPDLLESVQLESLDLSSNNLSGLMPRISFSAFGVYLSNNALSGSISNFLSCGINVSKDFRVLSLENNSLSGEIPDCWKNWTYLWVLNLNNNRFSGKIPVSIGTLSSLESLHLRKNRLSGIIPTSLKSCTNLIALDIGENELVGNVPTWIGEELSKLKFLNLRSNKFHGPLPIKLCQLASLQILDLGHNNLSGTIPKCIKNFTNMVVMDNSVDHHIKYRINYGNFFEHALVVMKGRMVEYSTILTLVRIIDFSHNNFSGEIPKEVTNLRTLQSLNLSQNFFTGRIPKTIGDMKSLESMDLSSNQLVGEIPHSITSLTFLSRLDLSSNYLTGEIPLSTQLQSFDESCFMGNKLCGSPLRECTKTAVSTPTIENGGRIGGNRHEVNCFYVSMAPGFVVGFWSIIGPLSFNRRLRHKYCHFLDCLGEKLSRGVRICGQILFYVWCCLVLCTLP